VSLDVDEQRAIIFLHELSHATGKFTHPGEGKPEDYDNTIGNFELTKMIYENCFKK
jgi:hypothetical protein